MFSLKKIRLLHPRCTCYLSAYASCVVHLSLLPHKFCWQFVLEQSWVCLDGTLVVSLFSQVSNSFSIWIGVKKLEFSGVGTFAFGFCKTALHLSFQRRIRFESLGVPVIWVLVVAYYIWNGPRVELSWLLIRVFRFLKNGIASVFSKDLLELSWVWICFSVSKERNCSCLHKGADPPSLVVPIASEWAWSSDLWRWKECCFGFTPIMAPVLRTIDYNFNPRCSCYQVYLISSFKVWACFSKRSLFPDLGQPGRNRLSVKLFLLYGFVVFLV